MSIQDPGADQEPGAPGVRFALLLRALAVLASVVSVVSLWLSEQARVRDDLQLSAEAAARPGEQLAVRAFYLRDVEAPEGPSLEHAAVTVRLLDARDRQMAGAVLRPARGDLSMEGALTVPGSAQGSLRLVAEAQLGSRTPLRVLRTLEVRPDAPRLVPRFREAQPLQQLSVGPLRPLGDPAASSGIRLEPRIVGGACVPEQPCTLLVWLGERALRLRVRHDGAATVQQSEAEQHGIARLELTVHGPEAVVALEAHVAGQQVAERTLRLPVGLGEATIQLAEPLHPLGRALPVRVQLPPGRRSGILDVYVQGRWRGTRAFQGGALELPADWLGPGLVRLQVHTDRFSGEGAAARLLYVTSAGEPPARALSHIAEALRAFQRETAAGALAAQDDLSWQLDPQRSAAFLLTGLEAARVPLPRPVSGRPRELQRLARAQTGLRYSVGGVLVLSALVVGMTLMRRGLSAQREAEAILREGDRELGATHNGERSSNVVFVVCLVLVVCLGFLLAALLIVAKPLWF